MTRPTRARASSANLMIKVIGFDLDDTLWAVDPVIIRAERKLTEWLRSTEPRIRYDADSMRALRNEVLSTQPALGGRITELRRHVIQTALERSGVEVKHAGRIADDAIEIFLAARNQIEMFDGAFDAISRLSSQFTLGALSNGNADISRLGLSDIFHFAFSAEEVGAPKPADNLFRAALEHTGVAPQEMIYVGDDPAHDIDPAKRLGIRTIWVDNGIKVRKRGETTPDATVSHVQEVPLIVQQWIDRT